MKYSKYILAFLFVTFFTSGCSAQAQVNLNSFFKAADSFMSVNVKDGKVRYKKIQDAPQKLNKLVSQVGQISLKGAKPEEKKAFYINAYNILTIHAIIANNIPASPMDVDGFFDKKKHEIAGENHTLNEIEKKILFPQFPDARIHFAIVCAAKSCPPIRPFGYLPDKLDKQLSKVTKETLNSDFIKVKSSQQTVYLSQIFKWYRKDFLKENKSVLSFINQYRSKKIPDEYTVKYYPYDWTLNGQ